MLRATIACIRVMCVQSNKTAAAGLPEYTQLLFLPFLNDKTVLLHRLYIRLRRYLPKGLEASIAIRAPCPTYIPTGVRQNGTWKHVDIYRGQV